MYLSSRPSHRSGRNVRLTGLPRVIKWHARRLRTVGGVPYEGIARIEQRFYGGLVHVRVFELL